MKHLGITGTREGMTDAQERSLIDILANQTETVWLHHGCCVGVDERAHWLAFELGIGSIGHMPLDPTYMMTVVDDGKQFIELREPRGYLRRNRDIVLESDEVIVIPKQNKEFIKGGTWYTYRFAKQCRKPIRVIWPNGIIERVTHG